MTTGPVQMHIADVVTAVPAQAGVDAGMVVLTENDAPFRSLRIIIGQPEANAIYVAWHGSVPGRPSTWDLYVSSLALLGARIDRVVITAVHEERHYFAHLELEHGGNRHIVACRPSDGLAVAVRSYDVGIWAEGSVLDAAGVLPDGTRSIADSASTPELQAREAALAAREAELAQRERELAARELIASAPMVPLPEGPDDATPFEQGADAQPTPDGEATPGPMGAAAQPSANQAEVTEPQKREPG